jgi:hypothetical protein
MGTTNTVSPLRQRMIEDMTARNLGPHSQRSHIHIMDRNLAQGGENDPVAPWTQMRLRVEGHQ